MRKGGGERSTLDNCLIANAIIHTVFFFPREHSLRIPHLGKKSAIDYILRALFEYNFSFLKKKTTTGSIRLSDSKKYYIKGKKKRAEYTFTYHNTVSYFVAQ